MASRKPPTHDEIVKTLTDHGPRYPMTLAAAVEVVRIHHGTTSKKALQWLQDIVIDPEPQLYEVWSSTYGFSSMIRPNTNRELVPTEPEGRRVRTTFKSVGLNVSTIRVDQSGQFLGRRMETELPERAWIMPPTTLRELGEKQIARDKEANAKALQRRNEEDAAFEAKHPQALDRIRAALGTIVGDFDAAVSTHVSSHPGPNVRTALTFMLRNNEISEFAELLSTCTPPSTQE